MDSLSDLVSQAITSLETSSGFSERPSQRQLALLISDLIEGGSSGAFEAPTGVGKSLAALIPSLIHGALSEKRIVIATYTNVLAEQYWKKDVPNALELISKLTPVKPDVRFLMGRQRYCCVSQLGDVAPDLKDQVLREAKIGHETEFKKLAGLPMRSGAALWSRVAVPVVCSGRLCPDYNRCFYYNARRYASKAKVVITNHSVVVQDAIMKGGEPSEGLLGEYDFLILDEAHDFPLAAANGLEFELSPYKMQTFANIGGQLGKVLGESAAKVGMLEEWEQAVFNFETDAGQCRRELEVIAKRLLRPGIFAASPDDLFKNSVVQNNRANLSTEEIAHLGMMVEACSNELSSATDAVLAKNAQISPQQTEQIRETIRNYRRYLDEFSVSIKSLIAPSGISVSHAAQTNTGAKIRLDTIGLAEPLSRLLWSTTPAVFMSATLAVDETFDFFKSSIGSHSDFEEVLDSPFDYAAQAALYLPERGKIPDPTEARKNQTELFYYQALAQEIDQIIETLDGRTLVLFHSRKEMEAVAGMVRSTPDRPIFVQSTQGTAELGEQFKKRVTSSLFGLRSFWTGFDAPGETLSCVVLVRIPFEVPMDPPAIARAAHLQTLGLNPFSSYSLPMAKMLMRQGAGRLLRTDSDRGVIAILDSRIHTKRYGEEILANLPGEMRTYHNFEEAAGSVGLLRAAEASLF